MRVHLDHNATTPLRPEARAELLRLAASLGGNPSSVHASGRRARAALDHARERVAAALGVAEEAILFTSGGTEANNLALAGALAALDARSPGAPVAGLAITAVEHSSVRATAAALAARGRPLSEVGVGATGEPDPAELARVAARPDVALLSTMAANNEVGAVTDLEALAEHLTALPPGLRPLWHVDAVQALGRLELDLAGLGVDLASLSAHKVGGPAGVGVLVRRPGTPLQPILHGGAQEGGLRPGTENVPAIGAAALAIELAVAERPALAPRLEELTRELWEGLGAAVEGVRLVGPPLEAARRLPGTLCVLVPRVDGRTLLARLDLEGLEASAGSACASGSIEPSHVLLALGASPEEARAALRFSIGRTTTREDVHIAVDIVRRTMMSVSARP